MSFGLTKRLDLSVTLNYVAFGGGSLDGSIFDFHDRFEFGQQGREFVADNRFQTVFGLGPTDLVVLDESPSGGFADPFIFLRYAIPTGRRGLGLSVAGGIKPPLADEDDFLSTGNWDFGLQLTLDRRWRRNALIVNLSLVDVGEFEDLAFEPDLLPVLHTTWIHRFKRPGGLRFLLQVLTAEHVFGDFIESEFTEPEFHPTIGFKWATRGGVWGVGLTENIQNMDNTPDIGLHFSWGMIFQQGD